MSVRGVWIQKVISLFPDEGADVIFVFGAGLDAVFCIAVGLVAVFDFLTGLGGSFLGVVVALQVTFLCKHEMSL